MSASKGRSAPRGCLDNIWGVFLSSCPLGEWCYKDHNTICIALPQQPSSPRQASSFLPRPNYYPGQVGRWKLSNSENYQMITILQTPTIKTSPLRESLTKNEHGCSVLKDVFMIVLHETGLVVLGCDAMGVLLIWQSCQSSGFITVV